MRIDVSSIHILLTVVTINEQEFARLLLALTARGAVTHAIDRNRAGNIYDINAR